MAKTTALRSKDAETKVGAILVNNITGAVIATGYNGFVRGAPDHLLPTTRPDKYDYIVHAEQNLICNCARHGISMNDCTLVSTLSPCVKCMRLLWQCGIKKIICRDLYRDMSDILEMKDIKVVLLDLDIEGLLFKEIRYE